MANDLTAVIGADISGLQQNINKAKQILDKYKGSEKEAERAGIHLSQSQVTAYDRVVKALSKVESGSMSLKQQQKALTTQITELRVQYQNLSDAAKKSDFGKQLEESSRRAKARLAELNQQLGETKTKIGGVEASASKMIPQNALMEIGKFAGKLSIAKVALDAVKNAFMLSEKNVDLWGRTIAKAGATYSYIIGLLSKGPDELMDKVESGAFTSDLKKIFEDAERAYNSQDALGTQKAFDQVALARLDRQISELQAKKAGGEKIDEALLDRLIQQKRGIIERQAKTAVEAAEDEFRKQVRNFDPTISDSIAHQIYEEITSGGSAAFEDMQRKMEDMMSKAGRKVNGVYTESTSFLSDSDRELYKAYEAVTTMRESLLDGAFALSVDAENLLQQAAQFERTGNRLKGGAGSGGKTDRKIAEAMVKEASQELDFWKLANEYIDARNSMKPSSMTYEPLNIGEDEDEIAANYQNQKVIENYIRLLDEAKKKEQERKVIINGISAAMSNLSSISTSIGGSNPFASIAEGAAQALPQVMSLVSAISALSVAKGTSSASNWIEMIAAATSVAATLTATIASVKKSTKAYADGGIIEGQTSIGDYNIARVNSGEMILNKRQQASLFKQLNGGNQQSNYNMSDVKFRIEGKDLVGVLSTYNKRQSKVL